MTNTYNGRTNRETRLVGLHFNPETKEDIENARNQIEDIEANIGNMFLSDYLNFGLINWEEIENNLED